MPAPTYPGSNRPRNPAGPPPIPANTVQSLPPVKYFENGKLRPELLDEDAMQVGKALAMQGLERAQLRRFYGDVLNIKHRFETRAAGYDKKQREDLFRDFAPEVKLLRAKVYYAHKRSAKIVPAVMKQFIEYHVNAVKTAEDFLAFCRHFEAVVAFHYAYSNSK